MSKKQIYESRFIKADIYGRKTALDMNTVEDS